MVRKARRINWSAKALQDKFAILDYWNKRNKSKVYSKKLDKLFNSKLKTVAENPYIGRITEKENVRTVLVRDCLIIYEIYPQKVIIVGIWEGHQNPQNLNY